MLAVGIIPAMRPKTPLIDFFQRVYAPLKLAERRSEAGECKEAIAALSASLGREATLNDVLKVATPEALVSLRRYAERLGLTAAESRCIQFIVHRGQHFVVPRGDPTPAEIEERAAEIRAGWTAAETLKRAGRSESSLAWSPPICSVSEPD